MAIRYGKEKNPFDELVSFINSNRIGSKEEVRLRKIIDRIVDSKLHQPTVSDCTRCKTLEMMIDNGLGWEDMKNDITYPRT